MKKQIYLLFVLVTLTCMGTFAQGEGEKPVVVIAPFESFGARVSQKQADILTSVFMSEYANIGKANVVDRGSFDKIKKEIEFQSSDWSDMNKVAELGRALNANHVVIGQFSEFDLETLVVNIWIDDVNGANILASVVKYVSDPMDILASVRDICTELTGKLTGSAPAVPKKVMPTKPTQTAKNSASKAYKIGDEGPGGGWIFYYSEEGFEVHDGKNGVKVCHYLEVSKDEIGIIRWCPDRSNGGCRPLTEYGLGYGLLNTYNIVISKHKKPLTEKNCAAYACAQYKTDSTNAGEWFLPSMRELELLYENFGRQILQSTTNGYSWLWSSSLVSGQEKNNGYPVEQRFSSGYQSFNGKQGVDDGCYGYNVTCVRAVRAF
ncbi:MAG: hypothetical protein HDR33_07005 [Treponema sp.]|nr:hypothetical protein [Treponema sp.]